MRATRYKHYGSDENVSPVKGKKRVSKRLKTVSFMIAVSAVATALIIPTTALAPDVNAYEDSKVLSFSVGDIDQFSTVILNNCIDETTVPQIPTTIAVTTEEETEEVTEAEKETEPEVSEEEDTEEVTEAEKETEPETEAAVKAVKVEITEPETEAATEEDTEPETEAADSYYSQNALISISNPDPNYSPSYVSLSAYDRDKLERLVMGEAGTMCYEGCALVAQAIRDAMNRSGTSSIDRIISEYQYYGSTAYAPNDTVRSAVSFIFDQNGSAVQHRVLCFYTGTSSWHETQNFIVGIGNVRFFDLYY